MVAGAAAAGATGGADVLPDLTTGATRCVRRADDATTSARPGEPRLFETVLDTEATPGADGLAQLDELQTNSEHPMRAYSDATQQFAARVEACDLAGVSIVHLTCSPAEIIRTGRQVRDFDPELCAVVLPLDGEISVEQAGLRSILAPGDLALYTSSQPFRIGIHSRDDVARLLRVQVPRAMVQLPAQRLDSLLARRAPASAGVGALMAGFLTGLQAGSGSYTTSDLPRLGNLVLDFMTATLAHELDESPPGSVASSTLFARVTAFMEQHLGDPDLSPPAIAAAHHISVSYLHRLFRVHETSVGAWLRSRRLDRARRDLIEPGLRTLAIHRIASRWGFADHATFTRAFSSSFGVSPRDYRLASERLPGAGTAAAVG